MSAGDRIRKYVQKSSKNRSNLSKKAQPLVPTGQCAPDSTLGPSVVPKTNREAEEDSLSLIYIRAHILEAGVTHERDDTCIGTESFGYFYCGDDISA